MQRWLLKTEPSDYCWENLLSDGQTTWDGVKNPQAKKYLAKMQVGDLALFYHTGNLREICGIVRVSRACDQGLLNDVEVEAAVQLLRPVTLAEINANPALKAMHALRQPRLSVSPISLAEWDCILSLGGIA